MKNQDFSNRSKLQISPFSSHRRIMVQALKREEIIILGTLRKNMNPSSRKSLSNYGFISDGLEDDNLSNIYADSIGPYIETYKELVPNVFSTYDMFESQVSMMLRTGLVTIVTGSFADTNLEGRSSFYRVTPMLDELSKACKFDKVLSREGIIL